MIVGEKLISQTRRRRPEKDAKISDYFRDEGVKQQILWLSSKRM
jgi:hypothetical protein